MVSNKNNWNLQKIQTMHTILIIEDEPRVASLLKNGLEENGYQTMIGITMVSWDCVSSVSIRSTW